MWREHSDVDPEQQLELVSNGTHVQQAGLSHWLHQQIPITALLVFTGQRRTKHTYIADVVTPRDGLYLGAMKGKCFGQTQGRSE